MIHPEHPLFTRDGRQSQHDSVQRGYDPGAVELEPAAVDFGFGLGDPRVEVPQNRPLLPEFSEQLAFADGQGVDFGLLGRQLETGQGHVAFRNSPGAAPSQVTEAFRQIFEFGPFGIRGGYSHLESCHLRLDDRGLTKLRLGQGAKRSEATFSRSEVQYCIVLDESGEELAFLHCLPLKDMHLPDHAIDERRRLDRERIGLHPSGSLKEQGRVIRIGRRHPDGSLGSCMEGDDRFNAYFTGRQETISQDEDKQARETEEKPDREDRSDALPPRPPPRRRGDWDRWIGPSPERGQFLMNFGHVRQIEATQGPAGGGEKPAIPSTERQ